MQIGLDLKRYVSFDDTGRIEKIGKTPAEGFEYLELEFSDVKQILEGPDSIARWRVIYDYLEKRYVIKHKNEIDQDNKLTGFIYEVPMDQEDPQVVIVQDNKNKCWKLKANVEDSNMSPFNQVYSVTKKYDPNVLVKSLVFNSQDPTIKFDYEFDKGEYSVYTTRRFSTYQHEVIDE